jgi:alpha-ketoglutarate-dependent 2,4-dichlorophenoxyacetate dioxygenase
VILEPSSRRDALAAGNSIFHVDSSFNPRRAGCSVLLAHKLPPPGTGGATEFADTRAAWDALPEEEKKNLLEKDYVIDHSLWHSRIRASPHYDFGVNPDDHYLSRHKLIQKHEASGRTNIYIAGHARFVEDTSNPPPTVGAVPKTLSLKDSQDIIDKIWYYCQQPQFVLRVEWENEGDLVIWDNTAVMHRATGGSFNGKYARDMRRATVHDTSSRAWGFNQTTDTRAGLP